MAFAMCAGFVNSGKIDGSEILVSAKTGRTFDRFKLLGVNTTLSNDEIFQKCDMVFLAVKPHLLSSALQSTRALGNVRTRIVVSVAAGVTIQKLSSFVNPSVKDIVRVMPNTPCLVQKGVMPICGQTTNPADFEKIKSYLESCGEVEIIPESLMDAMSGLSGCGPAFVYAMIEAMSDAAVKQGVPRAIATKAAAQTFSGAAEMVRISGKHTGALKDEVTSPGGATIAGIHALEKGGIRAAIFDAVEASTLKCKELGKQ